MATSKVDFKNEIVTTITTNEQAAHLLASDNGAHGHLQYQVHSLAVAYRK